MMPKPNITLEEYAEVVTRTVYQDAQATAVWFIWAYKHSSQLSSHVLGAVVGGIRGSIQAYQHSQNILNGLQTQAQATSKQWAKSVDGLSLPKAIADKTGKLLGGTLGFFHGNAVLMANKCKSTRPAVRANRQFVSMEDDVESPVARPAPRYVT